MVRAGEELEGSLLKSREIVADHCVGQPGRHGTWR